MLSSSADHTCHLWDVHHERPPTAPLLRFEHTAHSPKPGVVATASEAAANPRFGSEVRDCSFYYLDRFVLLAAGGALHLYSYALLKTPAHDAARAAELRHRYRLEHRWPMERALSITSFAAANSFLSSVALMAGSDRSLVAADLGTGQQVVHLPDAHDKPVHTLRLLESSAYGDTPAGGHDLFLSAALDCAVKLWDLRSASCVRRFGAHVNRTHSCGAALSPCLRYVCVGSEDKSAYLYDARGGGLMERLRHSDTVTDCAFSPLRPQLITATLSGHVCFHTDGAESRSDA